MKQHPASKFFPSKVANFCGRVKITCFRLYKAVGSARAPALSVERRRGASCSWERIETERVTELERERESADTRARSVQG